MAVFDGITIKIKLDVDTDTAEACLKIVEMYLNQTGKNIHKTVTETGEVQLSYELA